MDRASSSEACWTGDCSVLVTVSLDYSLSLSFTWESKLQVSFETE
jgi:hypothetical protein